jgi:hypothetical protein
MSNKISTSNAVKFALEEFNIKIEKYTLRDWCKNFSIGKKIGGRWFVDIEKLKEVLRGDVSYETHKRSKNKKKN